MDIIEEEREIITREEAYARGVVHYFNNIPCFKGHLSYRYTSTGHCVMCNQIKEKLKPKKEPKPKKERKVKNKDAINEYAKKWRAANPERYMKIVKDHMKKIKSDPVLHDKLKVQQRQRAQQRKQDPEYLDAYRKYQRDYRKKRSQEDPEFKKRCLEHSKKSMKKPKNTADE